MIELIYLSTETTFVPFVKRMDRGRLMTRWSGEYGCLVKQQGMEMEMEIPRRIRRGTSRYEAYDWLLLSGVGSP
jgi:hypothetical protein